MTAKKQMPQPGERLCYLSVHVNCLLCSAADKYGSGTFVAF